MRPPATIGRCFIARVGMITPRYLLERGQRGANVKVPWKARCLGVGLDELNQGGDGVAGAFLGGKTVGAFLVEGGACKV